MRLQFSLRTWLFTVYSAALLLGLPMVALSHNLATSDLDQPLLPRGGYIELLRAVASE